MIVVEILTYGQLSYRRMYNGHFHRLLIVKHIMVWYCLLCLSGFMLLLWSLQCLLELQREAVFLWTSELENVATLCFRAFEGSNYDVRVAVARLLGTLDRKSVV